MTKTLSRKVKKPIKYFISYFIDKHNDSSFPVICSNIIDEHPFKFIKDLNDSYGEEGWKYLLTSFIKLSPEDIKQHEEAIK